MREVAAGHKRQPRHLRLGPQVSLPLLGTGRERKPQLLDIGRPSSTYRALSFGPGVICRNPQLGVAGAVLFNLQDQAIVHLPACHWVRSAVGLAS